MTDRLEAIAPLLLGAVGVWLSGCAGTATPEPATPQVKLAPDGLDPPGPWPTSALIVVPDTAGPSSTALEVTPGHLHLEPRVNGVKIYEDAFTLAEAASTVPPLDVDLVFVNEHAIPVETGPMTGEHPHWEWVVMPGTLAAMPGRSWVMTLPMALVERNANCVHNGLVYLEMTGDDVTSVRWQIGSETCAYLKLDLWGSGEARWTPRRDLPTDAVRNEFMRWSDHRLAEREVADLEARWPGLSADRLAPPGNDDTSWWGLRVGGVHYQADCPTRFGPYPCKGLVLPSYSTAKSMFAALALMRLERLHPGIKDESVARWVPECDQPGWDEVRLIDLLDMSTGRYHSTVDQHDEVADYDSIFFFTESHAEKVAYACQRYPRAEPPGQTWVYHTTDTYLLGTAMQTWLDKHRPGQDLYRDIMQPLFRDRMALSPLLASTRRTRDATAQPFTGWGLFYTADDILRIARALIDDSLDGWLDADLLDAALQRNPHDRGLPGATERVRYRAGFYAYDLGPKLDCDGPFWVPQMSGYGGIAVVMPSPNITYAFHSDGGVHAWADAVAALDAIEPLCQDSP